MFNSYSLYGEDAILNGVFKRLEWINQSKIENLTYIDLGCFHPVEDSNTFFLYESGWTGTLVDANPSLKNKILDVRPKDLFLNCMVSTNNEDSDFFMFSDNASSNTALKSFADKISSSQNVKIEKIIKIRSMTLDDIVSKHIESFKQNPFFIDIDIEGYDLEILKNYSWDTRIPIVMIEDGIGNQYFESEIKSIMVKNKYVPIASTILSTIYIDKTYEMFKNIKSLGINNENKA